MWWFDAFFLLYLTVNWLNLGFGLKLNSLKTTAWDDAHSGTLYGAFLLYFLIYFLKIIVSRSSIHVLCVILYSSRFKMQVYSVLRWQNVSCVQQRFILMHIASKPTVFMINIVYCLLVLNEKQMSATCHLSNETRRKQKQWGLNLTEWCRDGLMSLLHQNISPAYFSTWGRSCSPHDKKKKNGGKDKKVIEILEPTPSAKSR